GAAAAAFVKLFDLDSRGTTVAREVRGGAATFLTMAYILFANPAILSAAGMPFGPVVAATAAASALASLLMALGANFPIALAPGMGLNANARLVIVPPGTVAGLSRAPRSVLPPVTFGSLRDPETVVALAGLVVTAALLARRVRGALLIGIAFSTVLALVLGVAHLPQGAWIAVPRFETFGKADLRAAFVPQLLPLLFSILLVDFFDTIGTSTAIAEEAGLIDEQGRIPGLGRL